MATPPIEGPPRRERPGSAREYQEHFRNRLIESRLTPNAISLTGFALCVVATVFVWKEWWIPGGAAYIVGSVCDTLDGRYSRMSGKGTPFGAFLDSTLDRIEEGIVLTAVAVPFSTDGNELAGAALGVECKVGIADRPVRVVILSAGLLLAGLDFLAPAVYVLAGLSLVTVLQRILHVRRELTRAPAAL